MSKRSLTTSTALWKYCAAQLMLHWYEMQCMWSMRLISFKTTNVILWYSYFEKRHSASCLPELAPTDVIALYIVPVTSPFTFGNCGRASDLVCNIKMLSRLKWYVVGKLYGDCFARSNQIIKVLREGFCCQFYGLMIWYPVMTKGLGKRWQCWWTGLLWQDLFIHRKKM